MLLFFQGTFFFCGENNLIREVKNDGCLFEWFFFPYKDDHCFFERVCNQQFPGEYAFNGLWLYRNLIGFSFFFLFAIFGGLFWVKASVFFFEFRDEKVRSCKGDSFFFKMNIFQPSKKLGFVFFWVIFLRIWDPMRIHQHFSPPFGKMLLFFWSIFSIAVSSRIKSKEANPKKRIQLTLSSDDVKPRNLKNGEALDTKSWKKPTWKKCLSKTARKKVSFLG